ncbi:MAG: DUF1592 domain-containing protein [Gemmataceae bacterium]
MSLRPLPFVAGVCLVLASSAGAEPPAKIDFVKDVRPILTTYCLKCHSGPKAKAGANLDFADLAAAAKDKKLWEKAAHQLRTGEMPPSGRPKPTLDQYDILNTFIDRDVLAVDCKAGRDPGRVTLRRLNKSEYNNTIRDLLGVEEKLAEGFPSDDVGYGFDNIGDVLTLSPLLLEKYLAAAERAAQLTFADNKLKARLMLAAPKKGGKAERTRLILSTFARRAYRRPVTDAEVEKLMKFVDLAERSGQTYERGIQLAVQAALMSPHFIFRVEQDRTPPEAGTPGLIKTAYPISDYELASRLSYFLWSSMPDEELFNLAEKRELNSVLEKQVKRMLKDGKSRALTENFAGQWLNLRMLRDAQPDPKLFPAFTEGLRLSMIEETFRFFDAIVKEDRSIADFIDADFTFVDETLARHYGISGVTGTTFRKVTVDPKKRGGILTQASILTLTSNPTRTSPVKRGKWILENVFNAPPPPPVPDAGELPEDKAELRGTLRQRMEQHRRNPSCATCHQRMDPLGFAFENYDAIGKWRDKDGKFDIDTAGELPSGQKFKGPKELRPILLERLPDFRRCLSEKLLTYALGRGLEYYDKCAVEDICAAVARDGNRMSAMVLAVIKSEPFQYRRGKGAASK